MQPTSPQWIIAQLAEDLNWWVTETNLEPSGRAAPYGILDPRQVAHLVHALEPYDAFGLHEHYFAGAFQMYALEAEIAEGQVRLTLADEGIYNTAAQLFALPLTTPDSDGNYDQFLTRLSAAHIRRINSLRQLNRPCTEDEMYAELDARDSDRFFSAAAVHAFDEINEVLEWNPAAWDDSNS